MAEDMAAVSKVAVTVIMVVVVGMVKRMASSSGVARTGGGITVKDCSNQSNTSSDGCMGGSGSGCSGIILVVV